MQNTIYVDVLILLNIFITYCLLLSTKLLLNLNTEKWRIISASVLGGMFSLVIFIDFNSSILYSIVEILMASAIVLLSFFEKKLSKNLRNIAVFYIVNFIFGGLMLALFYFITPPSMIFKNGVVYFNISALFLVISTIVSYLLIKLFYAFFAKRGLVSESCLLSVNIYGKEVLLKGFLDSGNKIIDAVSSLPVILCNINSIKELIPDKICEDILSLNFDKIDDPLWQKRIRVLSVSTVNKVSILPAFKPDKSVIEYKNGEKKEVQTLIGIVSYEILDSQYGAVIHSSFIN